MPVPSDNVSHGAVRHDSLVSENLPAMAFLPRTIVPLALLLWAPCEAQLVLDGTLSPESLVQNVLLGSGVTVSNVTFNGGPGAQANEQLGYFDGSECVLGMDSGLFLCTGNINMALGPNTSGSLAMELSSIPPADDDLDNVAGDFCMDVGSLEFDFVPTGDSITFSYSFASEEYLEYVNAGYNDAFGFFLSGPGISGPFQNDAMNLAVVPGTFSYVSVNSINTGSNASYYQDNGDGFSSPYSSNPFYFQFDGFTVGLTAHAAVQCGQTYHIKMAIGDVGDPNWDSGVFIHGGTFSSTGGSGISIATSSGSPDVSEGCDSARVTVTRGNTSGDQSVDITITGTASAATDVTGIPANVNFTDGQSTITFPISFVNDMLAEGVEQLELTVNIPGSCGGGSSSTASIVIHDAPGIEVLAEDVQGTCSGASIIIEASASGGSGPLLYAWSTGSALPIETVLDQPGSYTVVVSDACGTSASAIVEVIAPCSITVPNVFTPNGDGLNDRFEIEGIEFLSNRVRVFNRWGMVVFEAQNYRNTWAANGMSDGTYFYEVMADGLEGPLTGHLTILNTR